jgi:signal transduction histidine kinase/DNA-binding response OmpR family regulator
VTIHPDFFRYCLFFILCVHPTLGGQDKPSLYIDPELWLRIEAGFQQTPPPTTYSFIPELVTSHFNNQPDSVYRTHWAVMVRLEQLFHLDAAIYVAEEIARKAREQNKPDREAAAYLNLYRYYDALGTYQLAAKHTEKALDIYRKLGDRKAILAVEYYSLVLKLHFVSREEIIPLIESLLTKAIANDFQDLIRRIHQQLMEQNLLAGRFKNAEKHVAYLEKLPVSDPIRPMEYPQLINASYGRAQLALAAKNFPEAERYYLKTLKLSRDEPGPWFEVLTLNALTELELRRKNLTRAKGYLEEARTKAEKLQLHDLLTQTYALKSRIAERENKFDDALRFLKQKIFHEEKFKARSEGFNLENFYLQAERDKLAADEKTYELELSLKNSQLTYTIVILLLIAILAFGLVLGYLRERKRKAELALKNILIQRHADQLATLDVAKSRFFANISHELRTPLTLIVGPLSALIKENQFSEKQTALLRAASRNARQLKRMVGDILNLQKLDAGKMSLHKEPTKLKAFFQIHLGQFESLAQYHQIHYVHEVRIGPDWEAELDREKCRQILYNLLSNAIKFTPAHGRIEATVEMQDNNLCFRVADTGPGIPPDDLPHVFDRFFQAHRKVQAQAAGTGIGLSICHDYTRLMQGNIWVESTLKEGSIFYVSWPVTFVEKGMATFAPLRVPDPDELSEEPGAFVQPSSVKATPKATSAPVPTLLVVEDNPDLQAYLGLILSEKYRIITAENGAVALQKIASPDVSVDLVLSDLMMPVMDGYQLLKKLKSDDTTRHIPVIMLTARAEAADRLKALRIGVDDYLTKPFDEEELLVRIANLLKNQLVRAQEVFVEKELPRARPHLSEADQVWLEKFETYVRNNLDSDILSIPTLSETFAMSESTLLRQLKRLTGLTPVQYLQEMRLNEARLLLESAPPVSIATLATRVGYTDARSFSRSFKKRFGKLPSDFV